MHLPDSSLGLTAVLVIAPLIAAQSTTTPASPSESDSDLVLCFTGSGDDQFTVLSDTDQGSMGMSATSSMSSDMATMTQGTTLGRGTQQGITSTAGSAASMATGGSNNGARPAHAPMIGAMGAAGLAALVI